MQHSAIFRTIKTHADPRRAARSRSIFRIVNASKSMARSHRRCVLQVPTEFGRVRKEPALYQHFNITIKRAHVGLRAQLPLKAVTLQVWNQTAAFSHSAIKCVAIQFQSTKLQSPRQKFVMLNKYNETGNNHDSFAVRYDCHRQCRP